MLSAQIRALHMAAGGSLSFGKTTASLSVKLLGSSAVLVTHLPLFVILTVLPLEVTLLFAQSETGTDLSVRFSRGFSSEHLFAEHLYF